MQEYSIDVHNFDDIRPYTDKEIPEALARIMAEPVLYKILKYVYPGNRQQRHPKDDARNKNS